MSIHSKFLVHWTGWDFDYNCLCPTPGRDRAPALPQEELRDRYIKRFRNCCEKGLMMNQGREDIMGRVEGISVWISRVCFTEIRLSQVQCHAKKYGKLGIGFDRKFVLDRMGNPVFYVQDADTGLIISSLNHLLGLVQRTNDAKLENELEFVFGFLKGMSDRRKHPRDFGFYEEMEWRVINFQEIRKDSCKYIEVEDAKKEIYRLVLNPQDIKILIFPDEPTMRMATQDEFFKDYFKKHVPMMTTVEDCKHF